ncbi:hypothetical protein D3C73_474930 [compost metagenome]
MSRKYFTLEEANLLLPVMDQELRKLKELKQQFEEKYLELRKQKELQQHTHDANGNTQSAVEGDPFFQMEAELEFIQIEARNHIQGFHRKGVELKDIDIGLVDFPAMLDGEEVLLCWRQGEERINFYHSRNDGYSGRKPLYEDEE